MNASSRGLRLSADARFLLVLGALWLGSWLALTVACWAAGGAPSASPLDFVDPPQVARRLHQGAVPQLWRLVGARQPVAAPVFWAALAMCGVCASAAGVVLLGRGAGGGRSGRGLRTAARWATWWDLRMLLRLPRRSGSFSVGRRLGMHLRTDGETSVLVVGPTRSGKTTALVIPNLLRWRGPAVVTSTKSELVQLTGAHRQTLGPVFVYDPTGSASAGYRSVTWSPVAGCRTLDEAWTTAAWLCAPLLSGSSRGDNDWAHWAESGKLLIAPLLLAAAHHERTVVDVCAWIHASTWSSRCSCSNRCSTRRIRCWWTMPPAPSPC